MKKVKLFRYEVSNASSSPLSGDMNQRWYIDGQKKIVSNYRMETEINNFLMDKTLVSIDVRTIEISKHNNARGNTIHLLYTVVYSDKEENLFKMGGEND